MDLVSTPLLPNGYKVPASRSEDPSRRLRRLLATKPYVFGPGVYDPFGAELVMYHGFDAVYFSGYSFAIGHLGTTDMDIYSSVEIADGARRTVSALRKFQLTMAIGDPEKGVAPIHLDIPPVIVDMDAGYGNLFNVQRTIDLYVRAGVAAAHLEDQVMPKRCGHIAGKALISADEFVGRESYFPGNVTAGTRIDRCESNVGLERSGAFERCLWRMDSLERDPSEFGNLAWPTSAVCFGPPVGR